MRKLGQKGFGVIEVILVFVVIAVIAGLGWYIYSQRSGSSDDNSAQTAAQTKEKESTKINEENKDIPSGWIKYEGSDGKFSFYYPETWNKDEFDIQNVALAEYMLAPLGGGGGGTRFKLNVDENKWEAYEPSAQGYVLSSFTDLPHTSDKTIASYPVGFGKIGEGGAVTHFIIFTDGTKTYQVRFPIIYSQETSPDLYSELEKEQNDSLEQIIDSLELL